MTPRVTVVIPTYNRARDLNRALASVRAQTMDDWEVVVVDNHSQDETDAVVAAFGDERISLRKIHNDGVLAKSRNLGIREARAPLVAFLDSDDWWAPRKLERSVSVLNAGADVVFHDLHLVTHEGQRFFPRRARSRIVRPPVFLDLLFGDNALPQSSVVVRRTILEEIEGLSEDRELVAMEDYDAWLRVARVTERFQRIPQALGYYWAGGGNLSTHGRTLRLLEVVESRYREKLTVGRRTVTPPWIAYERAKALYQSGDGHGAMRSLESFDPTLARTGLVVRAMAFRLWLALYSASHS